MERIAWDVSPNVEQNSLFAASWGRAVFEIDWEHNCEGNGEFGLHIYINGENVGPLERFNKPIEAMNAAEEWLKIRHYDIS